MKRFAFPAGQLLQLYINFVSTCHCRTNCLVIAWNGVSLRVYITSMQVRERVTVYVHELDQHA